MKLFKNSKRNNLIAYLISLHLKVGGKELVCGFAIINHHRKNREEFPFEVCKNKHIHIMFKSMSKYVERSK